MLFRSWEKLPPKCTRRTPEQVALLKEKIQGAILSGYHTSASIADFINEDPNTICGYLAQMERDKLIWKAGKDGRLHVYGTDDPTADETEGQMPPPHTTEADIAASLKKDLAPLMEAQRATISLSPERGIEIHKPATAEELRAEIAEIEAAIARAKKERDELEERGELAALAKIRDQRWEALNEIVEEIGELKAAMLGEDG